MKVATMPGDFDDQPKRTSSLGKLVEQFYSEPGNRLLVFSGTAFAIFVGIGMMAVAGAFFFLERKNARVGQFLKLFVFGAAIVVMAVTAIIRWIKAHGLEVAVCEKGLQVNRQGIEQVFWWSDVNTVQVGFEKGSGLSLIRQPAQLTIADRDGMRVSFDETLGRLQFLRRQVEAATLLNMMPAAQEAMQSGAAVGFGPVGVSLDGVHFKEKLLPWSDIRTAEDSGKELVIRGDGRWLAFCKLPLSKVPNSHVLLALIESGRQQWVKEPDRPF
jgi:hypothetical protein